MPLYGSVVNALESKMGTNASQVSLETFTRAIKDRVIKKPHPTNQPCLKLKFFSCDIFLYTIACPFIVLFFMYKCNRLRVYPSMLLHIFAEKFGLVFWITLRRQLFRTTKPFTNGRGPNFDLFSLWV